MFNVCTRCGEYSEEKAIDASGPFAVCPFCEYAHRFERLRTRSAWRRSVTPEVLATMRDFNH